MSPLSLRRYRAERLLREEFEGLRTKVLATVRRRLASRGVGLDDGDLEACYAQAWQGLYAAVLAGQEIANPTGWLVLVTFRRAIEDFRSAHYERRVEGEADERGSEPDMASQMDDMRRLRQVFEALRERLSERECQAASLCYLQGLSRAQAAERMGISESRMRKLMEGNGAHSTGVSGKMGELLAVIDQGNWCEERGSLMRALAFGILDPEGERYQMALMHQRECPACRAYVSSLRGLAAVLPPLALPSSLGIGAAAGGAGIGTGALSGSAGVGSGGWLLAGGSLTAKFAGCLAAIGIGAGCLALVGAQKHTPGEHKTPVAAVGSIGEHPDSAVLLRVSSTSTVDRILSGKAKFHPVKSGNRHQSSHHSTRARASKAHRASDSLVAEAEFGPEHPHSVSELTPRSTPKPAPPPTPAPTRTHHSSQSGQSAGEFGFEGESN